MASLAEAGRPRLVGARDSVKGFLLLLFSAFVCAVPPETLCRSETAGHPRWHLVSICDPEAFSPSSEE